MLTKLRLKSKELLDKTDIDDKIISKSKSVTKKSLEKAKELKREIKKNIITAVTAALGFMIALTWRDAIQETVNNLARIFGVTETVYFYKFVIAVIITMICVVGLLLISRLSAESEKA